MSILDLSSGMKIMEFWINVEGTDAGEIDPALDALLLELEGQIEDKVEVYCRIIREFELISNARKEEADRIRKLSDLDATAAKSMKARLLYFFGLQGKSKLKTKTFSLSVCANGGLQPLELTIPADELALEFQKVTITPNFDLMREKIKDGEIINGVTVLPRGQHLRIK